MKVNRFRRFWLLGALFPLLAAAAPDVALRDIDGAVHHAKEYIGRGQWTVVAVWRVDCVICQRELPEIAFFHDAHKGSDATVLGVSVDGFSDRVRVKKFIDEHALSFPNLVGERSDIDRFGAGPLLGTPTLLIFTPDGKLASRHVGASEPEYLDRELARLKLHYGRLAK